MSIVGTSGRQLRVILLGDSITEQSFTSSGFGSAIQNWYSRQADVYNRGFSGYNSRWILQGLPTIFNSLPGSEPGFYKRTIITVFLGANDSSDDNQENEIEGGQGIAIKEVSEKAMWRGQPLPRGVGAGIGYDEVSCYPNPPRQISKCLERQLKTNLLTPPSPLSPISIAPTSPKSSPPCA
jgi:hypothetical protein